MFVANIHRSSSVYIARLIEAANPYRGCNSVQVVRADRQPLTKVKIMGFDQYHEPPEELSQEMRTFARMIASLIEEAEAIGWYEQRIAVEKSAEARAIMKNAQKEEFKHFGMNLEFLIRRKPDWRTKLKSILFTKGSIVKRGEVAEKKVD